ncbi:MAG: hypothetical protein WAW07_05470 [Bacteroidales bacterium]
MCGILGIVNFNKEKLETARRSLSTLIHRGPDQAGEWFSENIYLGHRRLSILDLSEKGKQLMTNSGE